MPSLASPTRSPTLSLSLSLRPRPLIPRTSAIRPRRLRAASKEDDNEAMDDDSVAGDLGFAALAALKSDPQLGSSDKGGSASLRGSDVLQALQRATARREKKKRRRRFGRKEESDGGEETTAIDGSGEVRPIVIRSDWGSRIEEPNYQRCKSSGFFPSITKNTSHFPLGNWNPKNSMKPLESLKRS